MSLDKFDYDESKFPKIEALTNKNSDENPKMTFLKPSTLVFTEDENKVRIDILCRDLKKLYTKDGSLDRLKYNEVFWKLGLIPKFEEFLAEANKTFLEERAPTGLISK